MLAAALPFTCTAICTCVQVTLELLAATLDAAAAASNARPPSPRERETVVATAPVGGGVGAVAAVAVAVSTAGSKLLSRSRHCGSGGSSGSSGGSGSGNGTSAGAGEKLAGQSLRLTDRGDGSYQVRLVRHAAADYLLSASLQGRKLPSSILCRVEPGPAHAPSCPIASVTSDAAGGASAELAAALHALKGEGAELAAALAPDGLAWAFEGCTGAAAVRAYDRHGNRRRCGGDQWATLTLTLTLTLILTLTPNPNPNPNPNQVRWRPVGDQSCAVQGGCCGVGG